MKGQGEGGSSKQEVNSQEREGGWGTESKTGVTSQEIERQKLEHTHNMTTYVDSTLLYCDISMTAIRHFSGLIQVN